MDSPSRNVVSEFSAKPLISGSTSVVDSQEDFSSLCFSSPHHQRCESPDLDRPIPSSTSSFDSVHDDTPVIESGGPRRRVKEQRDHHVYHMGNPITCQSNYGIRDQVIDRDNHENRNWEHTDDNPHDQKDRKHTDVNDGENEKRPQKLEPSSSSSSSSSTRASEKHKKRILNHICCRCASMFTADCAAVCCCPLALLHLAVLTFIRLPASLAWRLMKRLKPRLCMKRPTRATTENLADEASSRRHGHSSENQEPNPAAIIRFESQKLWQHFGGGMDFGGIPVKVE